MKTPIEVDYTAWQKSRKGNTARENYRKAYPEITKAMDELKLALELTETRKVGITKEEMKQTVLIKSF